MLRKKSTKLQGIILIAEQILPTSIQLSNKSNGEFDLSIWNTTYDEAFELSSLSVHRAETSNKNNDLRVFFHYIRNIPDCSRVCVSFRLNYLTNSPFCRKKKNVKLSFQLTMCVFNVSAYGEGVHLLYFSFFFKERETQVVQHLATVIVFSLSRWNANWFSRLHPSLIGRIVLHFKNISSLIYR